MRGPVCCLATSLALLLLVSQASGEITWVDMMENFSVNETLPLGTKVYTLRAVFTGTTDSTGIRYGFNNKGENDFTISATNSYFRINPVSGEVVTVGSIPDFEVSRDFSVFLIARTMEPFNFQYKKFTTKVTVNNVNDEKPRFENGSMTVEVEENSDPGPNGLRLLSGIMVTDVDGIIEGSQTFLQVTVQHCLIGLIIKDCANDFKIKQTGTLSTKRFTGDFYVYNKLDFENTTKIQVQLLASDGRSSNKVNSDIVVNVQDVQDLPPKWTKLDQITRVMDGTAVNSQIVRIEAEDQDVRGKRTILYSIPIGQIVNNKRLDQIFEVDPRGGWITNKLELDLEDTTIFKDPVTKQVFPDWTFNVQACEIISENPFEVGSTMGLDCINGTIEIQIGDVNDNRPVFNQPNSTYVYYLPENAGNGRVLDDPAIRISDADTDIYNKFFSELVSTRPEFDLIGANRNPAIQVKNTSLIDYDRGTRQYRLQLRTYDVDTISFSSIATIIINILDVNDQAPVFERPAYEASVYENAQEGVFVANINATDNDTGLFGTDGIQYSLTFSDLFQIDAITGRVTVAKCNAGTPGLDPCIDYDAGIRRYDLTVIAIDSQGQSGARQRSVPLRINILDVNDNPPVIGDYTRDIEEDQIMFQPDLIVTATDRDENADLTYKIISQTPNPYFTINGKTGLIVVSKPDGKGIKFKDGNDDGRFLLEVQVTDGTFTDTGNVHIRIIDINDNAPIFLPTIYRKSILETTGGGVSVLTITATDADDPTTGNGRIQYVLNGGSGLFEVDSQTGVLKTTGSASFSYELTREYQMTAEAMDDGQPPKTGLATIIITILDTNNRIPEIDPFLQRFDVFENVPFGTRVGQIKATDPDKNAELVFAFTDEKVANSDEGYPVNFNVYDFRYLFRLAENGTIYVNSTLDSRSTSILSFGVTVTDVNATEPQVGPGTIVINVKPFNTRPPVFENFTSPIYIPEEQPIGSVILSLIARDDVDAIEEYKITNQRDHPNGYFLVSPNTGAVSIFRRVDYDDDRRTNDSFLVIHATDTGNPPLSATASVSVIFQNINDNFPEFMDEVTRRPTNLYTATIPENSPDGTRIVDVFAFDKDRPDTNEYNVVRYEMEDDRFEIDSITGRITVRLQNAGVLDREQNPRILTQVIARDNPNGDPMNQRQRAATVQVILTDVNDNPPKFSRNEYRITIFETIGIETEILQLFTSDLDLNLNAVSHFKKVQGFGTDFEDLFDVKKVRGRVYVKKNLVRKVGQYWFYVEAQDLLGQGFTTNATVIIDVKPSANSPPIWVIPPVDNMTINVLEEQYNGMLIYDISARDLDTGDSGRVYYSFIYEGEDTQTTPEFKINKVTGVIQAEIVYDRELVDRYVLLLRASDNGDTPLETTRFLTINIIDVNDHAPMFAESEVEFTILETDPVGTSVGSLTATDQDLNPEIFYRILSGNEDGVFGLNEDNGLITLAKPLDRESKSVYYFSVQASNNEPNYAVIRNRRATDPSIINVKIMIGDANDLAPVFLDSRYYGCVSTRSPYDKHIITLQAIDRDSIGTGNVRYSLKDGYTNSNGDTLFGINEKYGIITNKVLMMRYADQVFPITVNARDGVDMATSESAETTAMVFVTKPGNEVKLSITQNTAEVRLYQNQIQSIIEKAPELGYLCITEVQDHVVNSAGATTALWSDVYVSGITVTQNSAGADRYRILGATELKNIILRQKNQYKSDYDLLYIKEVEESSSSDEIELRDSAVLIILIIIAVLIFLIIIFCILAFLCIRESKRQKKKLLVQKTNMTPIPIVEPQPEPILYDNRAYVTEIETQHVVEEREPMHMEHDPVHVQYAVVSKRPPPMQEFQRPPSPEVVDENVIVVGLDEDVLIQQGGDVAVYEPEYRIETELDEVDRM